MFHEMATKATGFDSDFFLWGYIKDHVYVPPLPCDIQELKQRIQEAATMVTEDMLGRVWQEFDYCVDTC
jgi:hypothetical protein